MAPTEDVTAAQVNDLINGTLDVLGTVGLSRQASTVTDAGRVLGQPTPASVLVVGETKRGKSSLVNALIGAPNLSPVDVIVATAVALKVDFFDTPAARVYVEDGPPMGSQVDIESLADWMSTWGNPENRQNVTLVQAWWPSPLLKAGLTLVDTPGVGGLDPAHKRVALNHLRTADALLFVLDSSGPISKPEIDFLQQATERVATCLLVMTKTDSAPSWRTVLDESSTLLVEAGLASAEEPWPIFPVSSATAKFARNLEAVGDKDGASVMRADSGFPALEEALIAQVARRRQAVRLRNVSHVIASALTDASVQIADVLAAADGDDSVARRRGQHAAELEKARRDTTRWEARLNEAFATVSAQVNAYVTEQEVAMRASYDNQIQAWKDDMTATIAASVDADLRAMTQETATMLQEQSTAALDKIAAELGVGRDIDLDLEVADLVSRTLTGQVTIGPVILDTDTNIRTAMTGVLGIGSGYMLSNLLVGLGLFTAASVPFAAPLILGGLVGAANAKLMRRQVRNARGQAAARTAITEALSTWSARTRTAIGAQIGQARSAGWSVLDVLAQARVEQLKTELETVTKDAEEARASASRRAQFELVRDRIGELQTHAQDIGIALAWTERPA